MIAIIYGVSAFLLAWTALSFARRSGKVGDEQYDALTSVAFCVGALVCAYLVGRFA